MRKYEMLPIDKLVSDVAVDPVHVRELADSIMVSGPISPVLAREENLALIDGFHRVTAMKELGFKEVETILTTCDAETFWDLRIMSASLHKAVTFARVIDWIDEVFAQSTLRKHWEHGGAREYKNSYGVFASYNRGNPPKDVKEWVENKAAKWGLSPKTIENWLYTKQTLAPELLKEATSPSEGKVGLTTYQTVAEVLSTKPELQKQVVEKAKREELTVSELREVSKAVREARDEEESRAILSRPFSRRAEEVIREVRVERLILAPPVPEAREVIQRMEMASHVIELKLVWEQVATMAKEVDLALLDSLADNQKKELIQSGERCIQASQKVLDYLQRKLERLIELPGKEV